MNVNNLPAYKLIQETKLGDIQSRGYLLCHKKTNARIMVIENQDENKVFNITFRTPPGDSTGVAHILEHSVFCGSKKFPLKDPFVELVKGSMNTFLNAMTFPDKTMYPAASCNDQDFQNLMHVYLDAVFFPNIYEREEIFRQEGWNYCLEKPEDELTYNGVVYNEMKGAFSSPDEVLERVTMNVLYPDSPYGVESGGDPQHIPDLTYEDFLDFHRKYYHPSNSYIYLYGNADMEEKLEFIDREYLSQFEVEEISSEIPLQKSFEEVKYVTMQYPVLDNESLENNTYLSYNAVIGTSLDTSLAVAFQVLDYALLSAPGAPLKQALLDAGIGKDIYGSYDDGIYQPYFTVVAKGANASRQKEFETIIRETLEKLAEEGIHRKSLEAGINYMEFRYREADYASYPKGLMYGMDVFGTWLYDDDKPFEALKLLDVFRKLKENMKGNYYENLLHKYFLNNSHVAYITLEPERGLTARRDAGTAKKLADYKDACSDQELEKLIAGTKALREYQEREEDPQVLKCIPMLSREDIESKTEELYNEEHYREGTLFLYHPVETNGIGYLTLYFDIKKLPSDWMPWAGLLKSVLGYVDTEHYSYSELFNEINANTGGIQWGLDFMNQGGEQSKYLTFFGVKGKALYEKMDILFEMLQEILFTSKLEDEKRLYEIIARIKSRLQTNIPSSGHSAAVQRALSYLSPMAWDQELSAGIEYYRFVEELERDFQSRKNDIIENLKKLMDMVFSRENLKVSFTGSREEYKLVEARVMKLKEKLPLAEEREMPSSRPLCPHRNEGFMTAGQVQYVAQVGNFAAKGLEYTGALSILQVILSYEYLWSNIRVKGGAYGCMSGFKRNGEGYFVSYRDPKLKNTLEVYKGIPDYIRNFTADEREMTKYIIGTISNRDVPKTPKQKGQMSAAAYFMGVTQEEMQLWRDQILKADTETIQNLASIVEAILDSGKICVIGSEEIITKEQALFGEIKRLSGEE